MDSAVYIAIALVVAIVLFLVFRKRSPAATTTSTALGQSAASQVEDEKSVNKLVSPPSATTVDTSMPSREQPAAAAAAGPEPAPNESHTAGNAAQSSSRVRSVVSASEVRDMQRGLLRSRSDDGLFGRLKSLFNVRKEISADLVADIEEVLLSSDVGVTTTQTMLSSVRDQLSRGELADESAVWGALRREAVKVLSVAQVGELELRQKPTVVLFVGVNGAGKTTTIGKLATKLKAQGKTCVLAAGDTFRAAAVQQLTVWGQRVGCEVVRGKDGADPGSVIFEAVKRAQEIGADVVLADTAGRLHTKANLMAEMAKIARTTDKAMTGAPHETLLVIDSTNGQNAFAQAKEFKESLELSGIVLTKLDGTAKGGVILGIADALRVPVRYVGLGERPDDLHAFAPNEFVEALLGKEA